MSLDDFASINFCMMLPWLSCSAPASVTSLLLSRLFLKLKVIVGGIQPFPSSLSHHHYHRRPCPSFWYTLHPPPPHNPSFLLLLLYLSRPPQLFQLDGCQRRLQRTEPDTIRVDDGRLRVTLECSSGRHAASWGEKGHGMWVEYYH